MKKIVYKPIEDVEKVMDHKNIKNVFVICIMALFIMLVYSTIGEIIAGVAASVLGLSASNIGATMVLSLILPFGFMIIGIFIWVKKKEKRRLVTLGLYKKNALRNYTRGVFIGIAMYSVVMMILYFTGDATIDKNSNFTTGLNALPFVLMIIPGWIIQSAAEEILTRGWLLSSIGARYNLKLAILVSSVFFAGLHLLNPGITLIAVVNLILIGIVFALVSLYHGDIWAACGLHFSWNLFQGNIFGCPVSGQIPGGASIIKSNLLGNELLTGGNFGPEAGLIASLVIVVTILMIYMKLQSKNNLLKRRELS